MMGIYTYGRHLYRLHNFLVAVLILSSSLTAKIEPRCLRIVQLVPRLPSFSFFKFHRRLSTKVTFPDKHGDLVCNFVWEIRRKESGSRRVIVAACSTIQLLCDKASDIDKEYHKVCDVRICNWLNLSDQICSMRARLLYKFVNMFLQSMEWFCDVYFVYKSAKLKFHRSGERWLLTWLPNSAGRGRGGGKGGGGGGGEKAIWDSFF